jgi:hypothetical protein
MPHNAQKYMSKGALNEIRMMYSDTQMNIFRQKILLQAHLPVLMPTLLIHQAIK